MVGNYSSFTPNILIALKDRSDSIGYSRLISIAIVIQYIHINFVVCIIHLILLLFIVINNNIGIIHNIRDVNIKHSYLV